MKRKKKTRAKVKGTKVRPRLSVFRSNKAIYAQVIDDGKGRTLVAANEKELTKELKDQKIPTPPPAGRGSSIRLKVGIGTEKQKNRKTKTEKAKLLGKLLAKKALKKGIKTVVFDRRGYKYHGRVKALAEAARKEGLEF